MKTWRLERWLVSEWTWSIRASRRRACLPRSVLRGPQHSRSPLMLPSRRCMSHDGLRLAQRGRDNETIPPIAAAATATVPSTSWPPTSSPLSPPPSPSLTLPPPSPEQQRAIDILLTTRDNLIIDAMAGSGKTTTILHLASACAAATSPPTTTTTTTTFLVLVYNRRLMVETRARAAALGLRNLVVLNYHTLGTTCYSAECATDQGLKRVVETDAPVRVGAELPAFDVLVLDEQQDLTPILQRFVDKVIRDSGFVAGERSVGMSDPSTPSRQSLRIVALGDRRQEVYGFNNADARCLTMVHLRSMFGYVNNEPWTEAPQTYSNRLTQQNVAFVNSQLLRDSSASSLSNDIGSMRANRHLRDDGTPYPKPRYIIGDAYQDTIYEVERLLAEPGIQPEDILILAPSTRWPSAALHVGNQLALADVPVMRADSDMVDVPPETALGRVLVCTYHQAKGIERRACVVLGFDGAYHTHYDRREVLPTTVSNAQYVAATRAVEHLVLVQDHRYEPLPFVNLETIAETCDVVRGSTDLPPQQEATVVKPRASFQVSSLCRNLSETLLTRCLRLLDFDHVVEPRVPRQPPPAMVRDKYGLLEGVANITGTAIPAIYEWKMHGRLSIAKRISKVLLETLSTRDTSYVEELARVRRLVDTNSGALTLADILFVANLAAADISKDIIKLVGLGLDRYDWISASYADHAVFTLRSLPGPAHIPRRCQFERPVFASFDDIDRSGEASPGEPTSATGVRLRGCIDIMHSGPAHNTVWEIKHMDSLPPEGLLQTALYMLIAQRATGRVTTGYLVSARTGQTVEVRPRTSTALRDVLQILVDAKAGGRRDRLLSEYSDEEFVAEAERQFVGLVDACALPSWMAMKPRSAERRRGKTT